LEETFVSFKARLSRKDRIKELLLNHCKATPVGVYHQIDTFFKVPHGKMKVRELVGKEGAHLIYYEREDSKASKRSKVWSTKINDPTPLKEILSKLFPVDVIVDKEREIFMCDGVQVRLDVVKDLGPFIELEKEVVGDLQAIHDGYYILEDMIKTHNVEESAVEEDSYSDLLHRAMKAK